MGQQQISYRFIRQSSAKPETEIWGNTRKEKENLISFRIVDVGWNFIRSVEPCVKSPACLLGYHDAGIISLAHFEWLDTSQSSFACHILPECWWPCVSHYGHPYMITANMLMCMWQAQKLCTMIWYDLNVWSALWPVEDLQNECAAVRFAEIIQTIKKYACIVTFSINWCFKCWQKPPSCCSAAKTVAFVTHSDINTCPSFETSKSL